MSVFRTALVASAVLTSLGLAGCQTTEERVYTTEYRPAPVVYREAPIVYQAPPTVTVRETLVYRDEPRWRRPREDHRPREVRPPLRYTPMPHPPRDWENRHLPPRTVEPFEGGRVRGEARRPRPLEGDVMPTR